SSYHAGPESPRRAASASGATGILPRRVDVVRRWSECYSPSPARRWGSLQRRGGAAPGSLAVVEDDGKEDLFRRRRDRGAHELSDLTPVGLGKPEIAVRPGRDPPRRAERGGDPKLADAAGHGDPPDVVPIHLGEPEVAIGRGRDPVGRAVRGEEREL